MTTPYAKEDNEVAQREEETSGRKQSTLSVSKPPSNVASNSSSGNVERGDDGGLKKSNDKDSERVSAKSQKPRYVYRDYSHIRPTTEAILVAQQQSNQNPSSIRIQKLPAKLHAMLSTAEFQHIISWLPHGRSWKVHNPNAFVQHVIPKYFEYTNYNSFIRLVNAWGFRRITKGPDRNSYYHELFLRGMPHLHAKMHRLTANEKKVPLDPDDEPDLYRISELFPLPTLSSSNSMIEGASGQMLSQQNSLHGRGPPSNPLLGSAAPSSNLLALLQPQQPQLTAPHGGLGSLLGNSGTGVSSLLNSTPSRMGLGEFNSTGGPIGSRQLGGGATGDFLGGSSGGIQSLLAKQQQEQQQRQLDQLRLREQQLQQMKLFLNLQQQQNTPLELQQMLANSDSTMLQQQGRLRGLAGGLQDSSALSAALQMLPQGGRGVGRGRTDGSSLGREGGMQQIHSGHLTSTNETLDNPTGGMSLQQRNSPARPTNHDMLMQRMLGGSSDNVAQELGLGGRSRDFSTLLSQLQSTRQQERHSGSGKAAR